MKWQCYSIAGTSFHFGRTGGSQEECSVVFPSDSLFAAMVQTAAQTEEKADFDAWIEGFQNNDPAFLLTSAYPRAGKIRFFPMPLLHDPIDTEALGITLKDIKKTAFLSEGLFRRIVEGESTAVIYDPSESVPLQGNSVRISRAEYEDLPKIVKDNKKIWTLEKRPRVTLDRVSSASTLFFSGHTDFAPECGLWFGISDRHDPIISSEALLMKLKDQGFGGLRSAGFGAGHPEKTEIIEFPDADHGRWLPLSRYLPAADEIPAVLEGETAFTLEEIGGWLYSPEKKSERRRTIRMIAEGAILTAIGKTLYGSMADVQPDYEGTRPVGHPVWRNGYAAAVGIAERQA